MNDICVPPVMYVLPGLEIDVKNYRQEATLFD